MTKVDVLQFCFQPAVNIFVDAEVRSNHMLRHTVVNIREHFRDAVVTLFWCSCILVLDAIVLVNEIEFSD